jgi:hypothetical protein
VHSGVRMLGGVILPPNEEEFLWRAADTKTVLNGTAARRLVWDFNPTEGA